MPPDLAPARGARVEAERDWLHFGATDGGRSQSSGLSGIYGPGRNAFVNLARRHGAAAGQAGPGVQPHPCRRHRRRAGASGACRDGGGIFNVTDDQPAPPQDVVAYAAD